MFDLRRQSVIQSEALKSLKSEYFGLISSVGDLEEKVAALESKIEELEDEIRHLSH